MFQFTSILYIFVLCVSSIQSAPPEILSLLLSPSTAAPSTYDANAAKPSGASHNRETGLTTYDQKQSGKYNIHLNIKDVAIIALDAGGVDGGVGDSGQDYYEDYDLSDFTVKPVIGLIEIISNTTSPNATEATQPLIHSDIATASANETENAAAISMIVEPILSDAEPVKNPQSLEALNQNDSELANAPVSSTAAPAAESSPSPTSISHKLTPIPIQYPIKPNEIPVQVILDPLPILKSQSGRQRLNSAAINANWRLKSRPTTPSHHRRITPPRFESDSPAFGNNKYRKNSLSHAQRRNCIVDQNGQCQNSQKRFSSPTL